MAVQPEQVTRGPGGGAGVAGGPPPTGHRARRRRGTGPVRRRHTALDRGLPYLLLLPATAVTVLLLGWPLLENVLLSFQNLNARQLIQHLTEWNGVDNYRETLTNEDFWRVTGRTVAFTAVNVAAIMVFGALVGLLLNRLGKGMRLLLSLGLVLAWAMPVVAATTVYQWLFDTRYGVVNWSLDALGWHSMAEYNWFGGQYSTFFVITLLIVWYSVPFVAFNLYAALTTIPAELYEAARMDGAGAWKVFSHVVLPILRPFFLATTFLEVIWVFKAFTQVYAINHGGPDRLTETLPVYAFVEGVGNQHYGMGAAISVLTIVVLLVLMSSYFRVVAQQKDEL